MSAILVLVECIETDESELEALLAIAEAATATVSDAPVELTSSDQQQQQQQQQVDKREALKNSLIMTISELLNEFNVTKLPVPLHIQPIDKSSTKASIKCIQDGFKWLSDEIIEKKKFMQIHQQQQQ